MSKSQKEMSKLSKVYLLHRNVVLYILLSNIKMLIIILNKLDKLMFLLKNSALMLRSQRFCLVPVVLTVLGFGSGATKVSAQTIYPFQATYDLVTKFEPITPDVSKVTVTGKSADAPYGLTEFTSMNYTPTPNTGMATSGPDTAAFRPDGLPSSTNIFFNSGGPDAAAFGENNLPILTDVFFGSGNDRLYGISSTTTVADFTNLTVTGSATETITGGSGRFSGAIGTLSLIYTYRIPDPTVQILIGQTVVNGTIKTPQSVPEPENTTTLVGMGVLLVGFLLHRHRIGVAG